MKRSKLIIGISIVLVLLLLVVVPAGASKRICEQGTWDNYSPGDPETYQVHVVFEGLVTQWMVPGRAQKALFVGSVDDRVGTCYLNVVTLKPPHWVMSSTVLQCDGELEGLHATIRGDVDLITFEGTYEACYHFDP